MVRVDRSVMPTMAKTPTLATWELEQLRTVENVVRRGHVRSVEPGRITFDDGSVAVSDDVLVVHCAASGLQYPPRVQIWGPSGITLQAIRSGFPCFGAALAGYVEATRDGDAEKNRLCPPNAVRELDGRVGTDERPGGTGRGVVRGRNLTSVWANEAALNPARVPPGYGASSDLDDALARLQAHTGPGARQDGRNGSGSPARRR